MNFSYDRAFDWRIVKRAGQWDHFFFPGEGIDDQMLKSWGNDFIIFSQKKNGWCMNAFCVGNTIEVPWNLQGNRPGEKP